MLVKVMWTELVMVQRPSLRPEDKNRGTSVLCPLATFGSDAVFQVFIRRPDPDPILARGSALSRKFFWCNEADAAAPG